MAVLNKEYIKFDKEIKLTPSRKDDLKTSRQNIKKQIRDWFLEHKPEELQPKFGGQGSFEMNTIVNPIVEYDEDENLIRKYDLDYGVYFIEKLDEDNKRVITTWHDWVYQSVEDYTNQNPIKKNTCVRVVFSDGHHIDLPIYYKKDDIIELAHKSKDWIESDPKEFYKWFNNAKKDKSRLEAIVRCLKAWKNFREINNSNLKLPSGFELTILATENYHDADNLDEAFRETVRNINNELNKDGGFKCIRPTTPLGEDVFEDYSETRKNNFLKTLKSLLDDCDRSKDEINYKKASDFLRDKQFGIRFPKGDDRDEKKISNALASSLGSAIIKPKPYGA